MIPQAHIMQWRDVAPWISDLQVEQDLILSRAIVSIFSDVDLAAQLAMRGGTVLNKIHFSGGSRYSEDIDLVQVNADDIGPAITLLRDALRWLGTAKYTSTSQSAKLTYKVDSETNAIPLRLKIEINTREHLNILGSQASQFQVENPWFSGGCDVNTYQLDELLGTKLRALYQRKKGRDLFDLWFAFKNNSCNPKRVVKCFKKYIEHSKTSISKTEFQSNLTEKENDKNFLKDIEPLLREGVNYDPTEAFQIVRSKFIEFL